MQCIARSMTSKVLPLFRLTPPGDYEADLKVSLSKDAFLKKFGQHLADVRGRRPTLVDGELLEGYLTAEAGKHPFGTLLERARLAGACPVPVVRPASNADYQNAIRQFLNWSELRLACIRITLEDLESTPSRDSLIELSRLVGRRSGDCILLIDAGPLSIEDEEGLAHLLAHQLSRLIRPSDWSGVIFSCTTFPEKHGLKDWQSSSFERKDWSLYRKIAGMRDEIPVLPIFSDYALEYPGNYKSGGFQPVAHLRYSTENRYFIFKGMSVKHQDKYGNIFRVAEQLVNSGIYKGPEFSAGDAYIYSLARDRNRTGSASSWRCCATDHHVALTLRQLGGLLGVDLGLEHLYVEPDQLQLILP